MAVVHLANDEAWAKTIESGKVVVDFSASWCGPCKRISPIFEKFAESGQYKGVKFVKVDVDECPQTSEACGITAMPTFQFYIDGKKVDEMMGASEGGLKQLIEKHAK